MLARQLPYRYAMQHETGERKGTAMTQGCGCIIGNRIVEHIGPWCVVYRRGGTDNATWHRSVAVCRLYADQISRDLTRMGFVNHVENYAHSIAIGLPEGM